MSTQDEETSAFFSAIRRTDGEKCTACGGSGECAECDGEGEVECECGHEHEKECDACDGSGNCQECDGPADAESPQLPLGAHPADEWTVPKIKAETR